MHHSACRLQFIHSISTLSKSCPVCRVDGTYFTHYHIFAERVTNLGRSGCRGKSEACFLAGTPSDCACFNCFKFLTTFIISLMKSIDIRSESAVKLLAEFLDMDAPYVEGGRHANAEHFAHGKPSVTPSLAIYFCTPPILDSNADGSYIYRSLLLREISLSRSFCL